MDSNKKYLIAIIISIITSITSIATAYINSNKVENVSTKSDYNSINIERVLKVLDERSFVCYSNLTSDQREYGKSLYEAAKKYEIEEPIFNKSSVKRKHDPLMKPQDAKQQVINLHKNF